MTRLTLASLGAATLLVVAGCKDNGPTFGSIQVNVATTGGDFDLDGYFLQLDDSAHAIQVNVDELLSHVPTGTHTLDLGDIAQNCTVSGGTSRTVTVREGQTAVVVFAVGCVPTGVAVTVTTSGIDMDLDGYTVAVDGATPVPLPPNGSVSITRLTAGITPVTVSGMAGNCALGGTNPRFVNVAAGEVAPVSFAVTCSAVSGLIEVTAVTSGNDLDFNGYTVQLDSGPPQQLAMNGMVRFTGVLAGDHRVELGGAAANCAAAENPRTLSVTTGGVARDTARTTFQVTCLATTGLLEVRIATSGSQLDANGYTVGVDQYCIYDPYWGDYCYYDRTELASTNDTVRFTTVAVGDHQVYLDDIASNCLLAGAYPTAVTVPAGDTARVDLAVTCVLTGTLQVTVASGGADLDTSGYTLTVSGVNYGYGRPVGVNDTVTITNLFPGDYQATLSGVASNCSVAGTTSRSVSVPAGGTVTTAFDVACVTASQLAFVSPRAGNNEIYVIKTSGAGLTRLTTNGVSDAQPAWSPDGSKIAFATARDANLEIYVMDADGLNPVRRTISGGIDRSPAWSPDGSKIAFTSWRDGNAEIYVMDADGQNQVRLTNTAWDDVDPAWSPDGTRIAFASTRDGNFEIYVMNADGQNPVRLTTNSVTDEQPDWSPDGTKLVFSRLASCELGLCNYDLFVMSADGSGAVQLTHQTSASDAAWSPDGSSIAFTASVCSQYGWNYDCIAVFSTVRIVRADGTDVSDLMSNAFQPAWRP